MIARAAFPGRAAHAGIRPEDGRSAIREMARLILALDADRAFLKQGGVFSDDLIDGYLELKWEEVYAMEHSPHPIEFQMYYSV